MHKTLKNRQSCQHAEQTGIALIEVLVSVILFSMGILALIGLQASMNGNAIESKHRAEAAFLANQLSAQLWVDQVNMANYTVTGGACVQNSYTPCTTWLGTVGRRLPQGDATVAINGAVVTITITWQVPSSGVSRTYQLVSTVTS